MTVKLTKGGDIEKSEVLVIQGEESFI